jgi:hypothetical protein
VFWKTNILFDASFLSNKFLKLKHNNTFNQLIK